MRFVLLVLIATTAWAGPRIEAQAIEVYAARRAKLAAHLGKDYALVIGQPLTDVMNPRQEGHFLYLTGISDHGAALLLGGAKAKPIALKPKRKARSVVFLSGYGPRYVQFHGLRYRPGPEAAKELGVEATWPSPEHAGGRAYHGLEVLVARMLPRGARLHVHTYRGRDHALVREIRGKVAAELKAKRPDVTIVDLRRFLAGMRSVKNAGEVSRLEAAVEITHEAFRAAVPLIKHGSSEAAVDGALIGVVRRRGAQPAYPFVVGGGLNATIPHYFRNSAPLVDGDMLVIDAGAAVDRYAADITRTFPVNGRFTPRQRECYEIVLKAQLAAIAEVKPGNTFRQVHMAAYQIIARAGLRQYFIHGTSHHVGLDVHDPGPTVLKPGMTLTVEPGIYIPAERIGIRIEDIVLVTKKGHRVLGKPLPKTPDEIERWMASPR